MDEDNWLNYISRTCGICGAACDISQLSSQSIEITCPNGHGWRVDYKDNGLVWTGTGQNDDVSEGQRRGDLARKVILNVEAAYL